jgi:hypothetical protein
MELIFDRVHFPNAYMPTSDFDLKELERKIDRLAALPRNYETAELIGMLEFLKQVPVLKGFCQFLSDSSNLLNDNRFSQAEINRIYETIHGPSKPGWTPMISTAYIKGLPGSQETMIHRGEYHQSSGCGMDDRPPTDGSSWHVSAWVAWVPARRRS